MLTSFFKGYKAEQFVVLFLLLIAVFVLYGVENQMHFNEWVFLINPIIGLVVFSALILAFWFIIQKNKLLPTGGIKYLVFVSLTCFFPNIICDYKLLTSALISTLILRKTLSLYSKKDVIKKLLDFVFKRNFPSALTLPFLSKLIFLLIRKLVSRNKQYDQYE